jgi:excisionase family DNA binding protein
MNLDEISKLLFVSSATVYRWIKFGMPHMQVMRGGRLLFDADKVSEWLSSATNPTHSKIQKIRRINFHA